MNGIQEVSGSIPLISTKKHRNLCCGVFLSRRSSALILKTVQNSMQAPTEVCRGFQRVKKVCDFFTRFKKRHIFCENKFSRKISLRSSKRLINQAFLMAINLITSGALFLAAARSRRGSDMPPACHSLLPRRRFATPRAPLLLYYFALQHSFLTVCKPRQKSVGAFCILSGNLLRPGTALSPAALKGGCRICSLADGNRKEGRIT